MCLHERSLNALCNTCDWNKWLNNIVVRSHIWKSSLPVTMLTIRVVSVHFKRMVNLYYIVGLYE